MDFLNIILEIVNFFLYELHLNSIWQSLTELFNFHNLTAVIEQIINAKLQNILIITFIPAVIISIIIYSNRKHQQPWYLLALAIISGLLTVSLAYIFNTYAGTLLGWARLESSATKIYLNADAMYGVGLVEESIKMLVLFLFIRKNKEAHSPYTGVLYGALIGLSFAIIENLMGGYINNLMRCFTSVPMHMSAGIIMGYYMSISDLTKEENKSRWMDYKAIFIPAILHGTYNGLVINISAVNFLFPSLTFLITFSFIILVVFIYIISFKILSKTYQLNEIYFNNEKYPPKYNLYTYKDIFTNHYQTNEPYFENRQFINHK